jgi:osmotically-inducible protein OsmY
MVLSNEELIKKGVRGQLINDGSLADNQIEVTVSKGVVTLNGTVKSYSEIISARENTARVLGVTRIVNNLEVEYPEDTPAPDEEKLKVYQMMKRLFKI